MFKKALFTILLLFVGVVVNAANIPVDEIRDELSNAIAVTAAKSNIAGEKIRTQPHLRQFYEERNFSAFWSKDSSPGKVIKDLLRAINASSEEGLSPDMYHGKIISAIYEGKRGKTEDEKLALAELDILCTDAFLSYASHLMSGFIDPVRRRPVWFSEKNAPAIKEALENSTRAKKVEKVLSEMIPNTTEYNRLKEALVYYRNEAVKGGWPKVSGGKKIEPGANNPRILAVRKRLRATGELGIGPVEAPDYYDDELVEAVMKFQVNHGLNPDGVIGRGTIQAMNTTPEKRSVQVARSMDTLRAINHLNGLDKLVLVNVPEYKLRVKEKGKSVLEMKVVVGRVDRRTPLLANSIKYLVFSPKWYVPTSIAVKDKLPKIHKNPDFIRKQGMKVFTTDETGTHEVDPSEIDWTQVSKENFNYRFVQKPSHGNALGTVKFMFPNRHSVYLHDTPSKYLFKRDLRPYSSGCVRIEKPVELAKYILKDRPEWTEKKIKASMGRGTQRFVHLDEHVPVHLVYMTAWADENGRTKVIKDVYNYDLPFEKYY